MSYGPLAPVLRRAHCRTDSSPGCTCTGSGVSREGTPYYIILAVVPRRRRRRGSMITSQHFHLPEQPMRRDRCALVTRNCRGFQDLGARQFKVNTCSSEHCGKNSEKNPFFFHLELFKHIYIVQPDGWARRERRVTGVTSQDTVTPPGTRTRSRSA